MTAGGKWGTQIRSGTHLTERSKSLDRSGARPYTEGATLNRHHHPKELMHLDNENFIPLTNLQRAAILSVAALAAARVFESGWTALAAISAMVA